MDYKPEWKDKHYYQDLGLDKNADDSAIKKAYRKLARQYHPDTNKDAGAEERFKAINEAYDVLRDQESRQAYDNGPTMFSGFSGGQSDFFGNSESNYMNDFLRRHGKSSPSGSSYRVGFEDLFGSSSSSQDQSFFEDLLNGMGERNQSSRKQDFPTGFSASAKPKEYESGVSLTFEQAYSGTEVNLNVEGKTIHMKIPAGIRDGQKVRSPKHPNITVKVSVGSHKDYSWSGNSLVVNHPISLSTAVRGATETLRLPDGTSIRFNLPKRSEGRSVRLKGKGVKGSDILVKSFISLPKNLTKEQETELGKIGL